jgi:hypothetical protein
MPIKAYVEHRKFSEYRRSCTIATARRDSHCARGAVLVELAIMVPVVFVLFAGIVDLGSMLMCHLRASQVVYEAAHIASRMPAFEIPSGSAQARSCSSWDDTPKSCPGGAAQFPSGSIPVHGLAHNRAFSLLSYESLRLVNRGLNPSLPENSGKPAPWDLEITYIPDDQNAATTNDDVVRVSVLLRYEPYFSGIIFSSGISLRITTIHPYLF